MEPIRERVRLGIGCVYIDSIGDSALSRLWTGYPDWTSTSNRYSANQRHTEEE